MEFTKTTRNINSDRLELLNNLVKNTNLPLTSFIDNITNEKTAMASVQAFEIAYELSWKILQRILRKYSIDVRFSKEVFLKAADIRLINDPKIWFKFLEKR